MLKKAGFSPAFLIIIPVNLTEEQVKNSPEIDTEKPVSRQQELKLYGHYPWTNYWGVMSLLD